MIDFDYVFHHVECAIGIMVGRREALDQMDITADGFWRSFAAIAVALPAMLFVWVVNARQTLSEAPFASMGGLIAADAVLEIILWLLPVLAFALVLGPLGFGQRFSHLIIARNWSGAAVSYAVALFYVPFLVVPSGNIVMAVVLFALYVALVVVAVRITQAALDTTIGIAIAFVAAELAVGIVLVLAYDTLLGFPGSA